MGCSLRLISCVLAPSWYFATCECLMQMHLMRSLITHHARPASGSGSFPNSAAKKTYIDSFVICFVLFFAYDQDVRLSMSDVGVKHNFAASYFQPSWRNLVTQKIITSDGRDVIIPYEYQQ